MRQPEISNILFHLPTALAEESFETIVRSGSVLIERIVSLGHTTPDGQWYDQERDEWVLLLSGSAELLFEDGQLPRRMSTGDHVVIPAGCRHRVTWTDPAVKTVWLAVHYSPEGRS